MLMVACGRKWWHFSFKGNCGPKANNCGKCLILFVTQYCLSEKNGCVYLRH